MENQILREKIRLATEAIQDVDPLLREMAFKTVLEHLLKEHESTISKQTSPERLTSAAEGNYDSNFNMLLEARFDWSRYNLPELDPMAQYLVVLKIALEEFRIDGLTTPGIQKILFEKFRIAKTYNAITMAFSRVVGKYVDRVPRGNGYSYRIIKGGLDYLKTRENHGR